MVSLNLLGDFRLLVDGAPVTAIDTPRLQSLLAYLMLHRDAPQSRAHLAFLFWPDTSDAQARTNLRNLLHQLRRCPAGRGRLPGVGHESADPAVAGRAPPCRWMWPISTPRSAADQAAAGGRPPLAPRSTGTGRRAVPRRPAARAAMMTGSSPNVSASAGVPQRAGATWLSCWRSSATTAAAIATPSDCCATIRCTKPPTGA